MTSATAYSCPRKPPAREGTAHRCILGHRRPEFPAFLIQAHALASDERPQLDRSGHYHLFGSEWLQCLLGWGPHRALKRYGTLTLVEVDLPFDWASEGTRRAFARHLLQEWTRVFVMGETFSPILDFSVILRRDIPAEMVVGPSHPRVLKNPFMQHPTERTADPTCRHCMDSAKA